MNKFTILEFVRAIFDEEETAQQAAKIRGRQSCGALAADDGHSQSHAGERSCSLQAHPAFSEPK